MSIDLSKIPNPISVTDTDILHSLRINEDRSIDIFLFDDIKENTSVLFKVLLSDVLSENVSELARKFGSAIYSLFISFSNIQTEDGVTVDNNVYFTQTLYNNIYEINKPNKEIIRVENACENNDIDDEGNFVDPISYEGIDPENEVKIGRYCYAKNSAKRIVNFGNRKDPFTRVNLSQRVINKFTITPSTQSNAKIIVRSGKIFCSKNDSRSPTVMNKNIISVRNFYSYLNTTKEVYFSDVKVINIDLLGDFPTLELLYIDLCPNFDFKQLNFLRNLQKLRINGSRDVSTLFKTSNIKDCEGLIELTLTNLKIDDDAKILHRIKTLEFTNCEFISEIDIPVDCQNEVFISKMSRYQDLFLDFGNMSNLRSFYYESDSSVAISLPLSSKMKYFHLRSRYVSNMSQMLIYKGLRYLHIDDVQLEDISFISTLNKLEYICLLNLNFTSFPILRNFNMLKVLKLKNLPYLTDYVSLANLKYLRELILAGLSIESINFLSQYQLLCFIKILNCPNIADFNPLKSIRTLKELTFKKDHSVDRIPTGLTDLIDVDYITLDDYSEYNGPVVIQNRVNETYVSFKPNPHYIFTDIVDSVDYTNIMNPIGDDDVVDNNSSNQPYGNDDVGGFIRSANLSTLDVMNSPDFTSPRRRQRFNISRQLDDLSNVSFGSSPYSSDSPLTLQLSLPNVRSPRSPRSPPRPQSPPRPTSPPRPQSPLSEMFSRAEYNQDISNWNVRSSTASTPSTLSLQSYLAPQANRRVNRSRNNNSSSYSNMRGNSRFRNSNSSG